MAALKVHARSADGERTLCGLPHPKYPGTDDPAKVTCEGCRKRLASEARSKRELDGWVRVIRGEENPELSRAKARLLRVVEVARRGLRSASAKDPTFLALLEIETEALRGLRTWIDPDFWHMKAAFLRDNLTYVAKTDEEKARIERRLRRCARGVAYGARRDAETFGPP